MAAPPSCLGGACDEQQRHYHPEHVDACASRASHASARRRLRAPGGREDTSVSAPARAPGCSVDGKTHAAQGRGCTDSEPEVEQVVRARAGDASLDADGHHVLRRPEGTRSSRAACEATQCAVRRAPTLQPVSSSGPTNQIAPQSCSRARASPTQQLPQGFHATPPAAQLSPTFESENPDAEPDAT